MEEVNLDLAGRELKIKTGELAHQADGAAVVSLGDTMVLATVVMSEKPREGVDFFPMMVNYEERFYAAGKIKGSRFIKREGRPSDEATLISRLTDRPLRPLFPKGMANDVQIICTVLSADAETSPAATAINAASTALCLAGLPFEGPVGAVSIGMIEDKLVVNPTYEQCKEGKLDLIVAGTKDAVTMVEAGAKEISEEIMLDAISLAHEHIRKICALQEEMKAKAGKELRKEVIINLPDDSVKEEVEKFITSEDLDGLYSSDKHEVHHHLDALTDKVKEKFQDKVANEEEGFWTEKAISELVDKIFKEYMRKNILENERRLDDRGLDDIRSLSSKIRVLPRPHGSGLFQRGETQILSIVTLGSPGSAQIVDSMDQDYERSYMHHYNFPPYSTGEAKMLRGTGRREIGHGFLAERALIPVIPSKEDFPYTIRVVSETMSCNGSSSMGAVCGSTLALMDAGVPIKRPVSGIAMGLVTDGKGVNKILTDIQGMEDFAGDMDFKVTGTREGITALQMDIKVKGISIELMREALKKANEGKEKILQSMLEVIPEPHKELSPYAPMITSHQVHPDQIRAVIGKGGETIQAITKECGVEIDIDDSGLVMITAPDQESGKKALEWVKKVTYVPVAGDVFEGKVVRLMDFGAFVEIAPGKDGLVHISQLDHKRVENVTDVVKLGDIVKVKLMEIDDQGRYNLSMKALMKRPGE
ncbi:MAG TPA: polyribonucleotide nucleotidyltransferase [Candidatus Peregrinibacteria bacterium]|nr:polyribonucleotide nucleotidyltransferase [Candidatus Peregrinibacteria bacterium]